MRLIDGEALRRRMYHEVFEKGGSEDAKWDSGCWIRYRLFERVLEEQATVTEPERSQGKWIPLTRSDLHEGYLCSECGRFIRFKCNFCSNCGADMRRDNT